MPAVKTPVGAVAKNTLNCFHGGGIFMVALLNYVEKKALHHCGNYCTTSLSHSLLNQE